MFCQLIPVYFFLSRIEEFFLKGLTQKIKEEVSIQYKTKNKVLISTTIKTRIDPHSKE